MSWMTSCFFYGDFSFEELVSYDKIMLFIRQENSQIFLIDSLSGYLLKSFYEINFAFLFVWILNMD